MSDTSIPAPGREALPHTDDTTQADATAQLVDQATRDIGDVPAAEIITTTAVHLMSAAAVKCGLADHGEDEMDLAEARALIDALAGLITASAQHIGNHHALSLRDGLRAVQLAFREASPVPDEPGSGPGEKYTSPVS